MHLFVHIFRTRNIACSDSVYVRMRVAVEQTRDEREHGSFVR